MQKDLKLYTVAIANNTIRALGIATSVFAVFVLSHRLSADEFGDWAWLLSICTLITAQDFGVISAMRIEVSKLNHADRIHSNRAQQNLLVLATVLLVFVVLLLAVILLGLLSIAPFKWGVIKAPFGLFALVVFIALLSLLGTVAANTLYGFLKSEKVTLLDFSRNIFQLAAVVAIYFWQPLFEWAILIYFIPYVLYAAVGVVLALEAMGLSEFNLIGHLHTQLGSCLADLAALIKKGAPLWAIQLSNLIYSGSELVYVGFFANEVVIGQTAILQRYTVIAIGFITASIAPFLGHYASKIHHASPEDIAWVRQKSDLKTKLVLLTGILYTIFLMSFGHKLTLLWSGREIDSPWLYFLVGLVFTATGINSLFQLFYQSSKVYVSVIYALLFCGALKLIGIALLWSHFEILGVWISFLLGNLALLFFNLFFVRRAILIK